MSIQFFFINTSSVEKNVFILPLHSLREAVCSEPTISGGLWSWGYNKYGALGQGDTIDKSVPTQIGSSTDWK